MTTASPLPHPVFEEQQERIEKLQSREGEHLRSYNFSQVVCTETEPDYILMEKVARRRKAFGRYEGL